MGIHHCILSLSLFLVGSQNRSKKIENVASLEEHHRFGAGETGPDLCRSEKMMFNSVQEEGSIDDESALDALTPSDSEVKKRLMFHESR
jgi:hypothetical protein